MLLVDKKEVKMPKKYQKVLNICPAINDTVVFLGIRGFREDCLTHFDKEGKLLDEIVFEHNMDSFAMLSESEVMILETRKSCFTVWNLENHEQLHVPFNFKNQEVDQSMIFVFPETRTVCIQQNGRYNDNTFKLSYYNLPIKSADVEPFLVYDSEEVWTYEFMIRKANNHSMLCWFKGRHDDGFEFRTFDFRDVKQGKYNKYELPNQVGKPYGMAKTEVAITTMWEMRPLEFLMVCISNRPDTPDGPPNNNYVADIKTKTVRESKFKLGKLQDLHLDQHYMGNTCMFRTFDFENGNALETPVYYVNNETEEVVAEETWKCSYLHKYEFPGYDGNMVVEGMYENADVEQVTLMSKKVMDPKEISVHFLVETVEKVDEDLLYDVTKIIDYSK